MRRVILVVGTTVYLLFCCAYSSRNLHLNKTANSVPAAAKKLMKCYPSFIIGFADNHLIFKDGSKLLWDDGIKNKPFKTLLDEPDVKDMFVQPYKIGPLSPNPGVNDDPGRIRNEPFFLKMWSVAGMRVKVLSSCISGGMRQSKSIRIRTYEAFC